MFPGAGAVFFAVRARNEISGSDNAQDFDLSPRRCCSSIAGTMVQNRNAGIRLKDKQDVTVILFRALSTAHWGKVHPE